MVLAVHPEQKPCSLDSDFNAYARKALGLCKIVYEVITEQKLSEFLITSDDIINSMIGLSVTAMKLTNQAPYISVLDKSLALENELNKFYELVESEFVMVDQLLQGDFPAELKFLYGHITHIISRARYYIRKTFQKNFL